MTERIKIDGIYDLRSIERLEGLGIIDIGFDFRPKSFNFLQQYRFLELFCDNFLPENRYYLHFSNEKNFVIMKFLADILNVMSGSVLFDLNRNIILEFSDTKDYAFYDQFKVPYLWHYSIDYKLTELLDKSQYLKGMIIPYSILKQHHIEGSLYSFIQTLLQIIFERKSNTEFLFLLSLDWDSDIFPSVFELIDFDIISFQINRKVELCYRNVDWNVASEGIVQFRRNMMK